MSGLTLPGSEAEVISISDEKWAALSELDRHAHLRQELAESGVSQHVIEALYPFSFADVVEGLLPLIKSDTFAACTVSSVPKLMLAPLQNRLFNLSSKSPGVVRQLVQAQLQDPEVAQQLAVLMTAVHGCMPEQLLPVETAPDFARNAIMLLCIACTMHAKLADWNEEERYEVREFFFLAVEKLVPAL